MQVVDVLTNVLKVVDVILKHKADTPHLDESFMEELSDLADRARAMIERCRQFHKCSVLARLNSAAHSTWPTNYLKEYNTEGDTSEGTSLELLC